MSEPSFNLARVLRVIFWVLSIYLIGLLLIIYRHPSSFNPPPQTAWGLYEQGKSLVIQKKYAEGQHYLQMALARNPGLYRAKIEMGVSYMMQGEFIYARSWFEDALKTVGNDTYNKEACLYDLGRVYLCEHNPDKAWGYYRSVWGMERLLSAKQWPDDPTDPVYYVMDNDRQKFNTMLQKYEPSEIWDRDHQLRQWSLWHQAKRIARDCAGYLKRNPQSRYTQRMVRWEAWVAFDRDQYDKAIVLLDSMKNCSICDEDKGWVMSMRYWAYKYKGAYPKALALLKDGVVNDPADFPFVWSKFEAAEIYRKMGDVAQEKHAYEELIDEYPDGQGITKAQTRLMEILSAQGQYAQAWQYYKQVFAFKKVLWLFLAVLLGIGFLVFLFFIFSRIFFVRQLAVITASGFRLWHVWLLTSVTVLFSAFGPYFFFQINEMTGNFLGRMHLDPFLSGTIVMNLAMAAVYVFWMSKGWGWNREQIGLVPRGIAVDFGIPFLVALGMTMPAAAWQMYLAQGLKMHNLPEHPMSNYIHDIFLNPYLLPKVLMVITLVVAAPVAEEIFFRVFLFQTLKTYSNTFWAAAFSALCFAVGHDMPVMIPYYFLVAVSLQTLYLRTKSIYPCIMAHAFLNLLIIFVSF